MNRKFSTTLSYRSVNLWLIVVTLKQCLQMIDHSIVLVGKGHPDQDSSCGLDAWQLLVNGIGQIAPASKIEVSDSSIKSMGDLQGLGQPLAQFLINVVKECGHSAFQYRKSQIPNWGLSFPHRLDAHSLMKTTGRVLRVADCLRDLPALRTLGLAGV